MLDLNLFISSKAKIENIEKERRKELEFEIIKILKKRQEEKEEIENQLLAYNEKQRLKNITNENTKSKTIPDPKTLQLTKNTNLNPTKSSITLKNEHNIDLCSKEKTQNETNLVITESIDITTNFSNEVNNKKSIFDKGCKSADYGFKLCINLSQNLVDKYLVSNDIKQVFSKIKERKEEYQNMQMIKLINKRLSQLTTDLSHIKKISLTLDEYKDDIIFINYFTSKILEQGMVQVSVHNESYKSYAYLFSLLFTNNLFILFRYKLLTLEENYGDKLKGGFMIFFGILKLRNLADDAKFFLEDVVSVEPSENTLIIIETFLSVFEDNIKFLCESGLEKIKHFLNSRFEVFGKYEAVKMRISNKILNSFENQKKK